MTDSLEMITSDAKRCTACPLHKTRKHVVIAEVHGTPRVLLIGQSPGDNEDETGQPFQGRAGTVLRIQLARIRLHDNYGIVNTICCHPPHNKYEMRYGIACSPLYERKIQLLAPEFVVLLGRDAERIWDSYGDQREQLFPSVRSVSRMLHPAALTRPHPPEWDARWIQGWDAFRAMTAVTTAAPIWCSPE